MKFIDDEVDQPVEAAVEEGGMAVGRIGEYRLGTDASRNDYLLGFIGPPVHYALKDGAKPTFLKSHLVPLALKDNVATQMDRLLQPTLTLPENKRHESCGPKQECAQDCGR
ncbi:hypothetical protein MRX96_052311 [Rhipicephalus microplus]